MVNAGGGLSVAILGTRGVPPRYGGFETFAGELGPRLVARGHRVTVYCREALYNDESSLWRGVERIELPAIRHKYLETVSHSALSSIDALRRGFDVVVLCNAANAFVLPLLRAVRVPVAVNVDGIERKRRKWSAIGRLVYAAGESLSAGLASAVIADAETIAAYYREFHTLEADVIPYGSDFPEEPDTDVLERLGVSPQGYVLYVSRFEPENNPLEVVQAYRRVRSDLPLVMVGDAPYARELVARVCDAADARVILPGAVYGADYRTLQRNASIYVQATEVGGTHPAMIEAMGSNGVVLANDTPENREVGGEAVQYFRFDRAPRLEEVLQKALDDPELRSVYRDRARIRAESSYSWDVVTAQYEALLMRLAGAGTARVPGKTENDRC